MLKLLISLIPLIFLAGCRSDGGAGASLDSAVSPNINERGSAGGRDIGTLVSGELRDTVNVDTDHRPRTSPEPSTLILIGTGLAGIVGSALRKKRKT